MKGMGCVRVHDKPGCSGRTGTRRQHSFHLIKCVKRDATVLSAIQAQSFEAIKRGLMAVCAMTGMAAAA
jgi:hypothetical protein